MMNFRIIKKALEENILKKNESLGYKTFGHQAQGISSEPAENKKMVFVYAASGDFDGRTKGSVSHKIIFNIELTVNSRAMIDLSALESENQAIRAAALENLETAGKRNDDVLDELIDIVWNLVSDGRNDYLGVDETKYPNLVVANRYVDSWQKDEPVQRGDIVINTAIMKVSCKVTEQPDGLVGVPSDSIQDSIYVNESPVENTGIIIEGE